VRTVDLQRPLPDITDLGGYDWVRAFALHGTELVGFVELPVIGNGIGARRLGAAFVDHLLLKPVAVDADESDSVTWSRALKTLREELLRQQPRDRDERPLDERTTVSVVVITFDRPDDLRRCLRCIRAQSSERMVEVVVVDNHPSSSLTPPVVEEFDGVRLVEEQRQGAGYARNAGILASTGEIVVMVDDDVEVPPDWLEKLIAPLRRNDVAAVTGNVLPLHLETRSQQLFEIYGGLSRGFERREFDAGWFERSRWGVPTWWLGGTANAAFRSSLFRDPTVGLLIESLGPGMPAGVGEDTYLFYKILKAGHTIVYEPNAYVWHRHRRDMAELRRQLYAYSKGHVAYHLVTLLEDRDIRALAYLAIRLPYGHLHRLARCVRGRSSYPVNLLLLEIRGNLIGPLALWRSARRVRRQGSLRSGRHVPQPAERGFS
jgi:glycosyltransferase involved in cell wall biosynthesis